MWKAVVLAVSVLVARTCATEVPSEFGVKLCGREFIRAVIFTCGGSRWRRGAMSSGGDDVSHDPWDRRTQSSVPRLPGQQLQDLAAAVWSREAEGEPSFGRSAPPEDVLEALRSADRAGRDVVVGLSSACCKWGCSKNEISSLC